MDDVVVVGQAGKSGAVGGFETPRTLSPRTLNWGNACGPTQASESPTNMECATCSLHEDLICNV